MKNCKFCDKDETAWLYTMTYAVVVGANAGDLAALPALSGTLGAGVTDIKLSDRARYAIRRARPGYIYVLIERFGYRYWRAYMVLEDSFMYEFDAERPPTAPVEFTCERNACGVGASVIGIDKVNSVDNVWVMFTPTAMTKAKLDEYRVNAPAYASKGKMRYFDAKGWVEGNRAQPHTLKPEQLMTTAAEFILFRQHAQALTSPLGLAMKKQLFPGPSDAYAGTPANPDGSENGFLGVLAKKLAKQEAAVLVLDDHIGITQELNDFRNAALEPVQTYLDKTDEQQISNERKLTTYEAVQEVQNGFRLAYFTDNKEYLDTSRNQSEQRQTRRLEQARFLRLQGRHDDANAIEQDVARLRATRDKNYAKLLAQAQADAPKRWQMKYVPLLDEPEMAATINGMNAVLDTSKQQASGERADDHLKWLKANRFIDAFDVYDDTQLVPGFQFAAHAAACTFGMGGIDKCAAQMDKWISAPTIDRKNLFMRAFTYNQRDLKKEVEQALAAAKAAAGAATASGFINWDMVQKSTKGLLDGFKKVDSAWDEYMRNKNQRGAAFKYRFEALAYQKLSEVGRTLFRVGLGNQGDVKLVAGLGALLYGRVGDVAEKLRFEELMYRIDPENALAPREVLVDDPKNPGKKLKVAGPNVAATSEAGTPRRIDAEAALKKARAARELVAATLDEALAKGNSSNYHQIRVGVVITLLEAVNLASQIGKERKGSEEYLKIAGASFALVSTSLDLAYTGAKLIREHAPAGPSRAAVRGAGETVRGGLKLASGMFSCAAGGIGAWLDFRSAASEPNSNFLRAIYVCRGFAGSVSSALAVVAGLSYCGTWISRLSLKVAQDSVSKEAAIAAGRSLMALGERVALLRWVARFNLVGLAFTGGEIFVRVFIIDDALESWCKRSVFRKDKGTGFFGAKPFDSQDEELKVLYTAYAELT